MITPISEVMFFAAGIEKLLLMGFPAHELDVNCISDRVRPKQLLFFASTNAVRRLCQRWLATPCIAVQLVRPWQHFSRHGYRTRWPVYWLRHMLASLLVAKYVGQFTGYVVSWPVHWLRSMLASLLAAGCDVCWSVYWLRRMLASLLTTHPKYKMVNMWLSPTAGDWHCQAADLLSKGPGTSLIKHDSLILCFTWQAKINSLFARGWIHTHLFLNAFDGTYKDWLPSSRVVNAARPLTQTLSRVCTHPSSGFNRTHLQADPLHRQQAWNCCAMSLQWVSSSNSILEIQHVLGLASMRFWSVPSMFAKRKFWDTRWHAFVLSMPLNFCELLILELPRLGSSNPLRLCNVFSESWRWTAY